MGSSLTVDGETIPNPDRAAIERGFDSIEPGNWWSRGISIVELRRDESHSLTLSGHPVEGWGYVEVVDEDQARTSFPKPALPQARAVAIMQNYQSGDDSWTSEFNWDLQKAFKPTAWTGIRDLVIMLGAFALLVYLLRWFQRL